MNFLKLFEDFVNEAVLGLNRIEKDRYFDDNVIYKMFKGDKLKVKEFIQDKLNRIFKNPVRLDFISGGAMGYAFIFGDKVLKISSDESEAMNAKYLIEKKPEYIAKYYWVKKIKIDKYKEWKENTDPRPGKKTRIKNGKTEVLRGEYNYLYIICLEKLKMLTKEEKEFYYALRCLFDDNYFEGNDLNERLNKFLEYLKDPDVNKKFEMDGKVYYENKKYLELDTQKVTFENLKMMYDNMIKIYKAVSNLEGFKLSDFHSGNIGYNDNGVMVYFDPGCETTYNYKIEEI